MFLLLRRCVVLLVIYVIVCISYGYSLGTNDKLNRLREKHFRKRLINTTLENLPNKNNTKREYVYYPESGHRGHFHGHFHDFGHLHDFGEHAAHDYEHDYGHGGYDSHNYEGGHGTYDGGHGSFEGGHGGGYEQNDQCCDDDDEVPEYTHTHHVVRYHHHISKTFMSSLK